MARATLQRALKAFVKTLSKRWKPLESFEEMSDIISLTCSKCCSVQKTDCVVEAKECSGGSNGYLVMYWILQ